MPLARAVRTSRKSCPTRTRTLWPWRTTRRPVAVSGIRIVVVPAAKSRGDVLGEHAVAPVAHAQPDEAGPGGRDAREHTVQLGDRAGALPRQANAGAGRLLRAAERAIELEQRGVGRDGDVAGAEALALAGVAHDAQAADREV